MEREGREEDRGRSILRPFGIILVQDPCELGLIKIILDGELTSIILDRVCTWTGGSMKFIYTYLSLLYEEDMPVFTYQSSRLRVVRSIKFFLILNTNVIIEMDFAQY